MFSVIIGIMGFGFAENQDATVTVDPEVVVTIGPADFGSVVPGATPSNTCTIDNSQSNVDVLLDQVTLQTASTLFDSLTIDGTAYASFSTTVLAFGTSDIVLQITVPEDATPDTITNVIVYTVTGPAPA